VRRGERVEGVTGIVVTTKLGRANVRRATSIGELPDTIELAPGDPVYLLHPLGEGYWKFWVRGRTGSEELPIDECTDRRDPILSCPLIIARQPRIVWWVRIRNAHGKEGWTRQVEHFDDIDACA